MRLKADRKKLLLLLTAVLVVAAYLLQRQATGLYIPCVFHSVTGLQCPGCGSTRMLTALMHLDIKRAFEANPFLLLTGPLLAFEIFYDNFTYHTDKAFEHANSIVLIAYCICTLLFGVLRNL